MADPSDSDKLLAILGRIAGSRRNNPARLPAKQLSGSQLPANGGTITVLALDNDQTIGGGVIELRSPYCWVTWTIDESRDGSELRRQVARTGPFTSDAVRVSSGATVSATIARRWTAAHPSINPLTGVGISDVPAPGFTAPIALVAEYIPGITTADVAGLPSLSLYFAGGTAPADGPVIPVGGPSILAFPIDYYRSCLPSASLIAIVFNACIPNDGAAATWLNFGASVVDGGPDQYAARAVNPGPWGCVRVINPGVATALASLRWTP